MSGAEVDPALVELEDTFLSEFALTPDIQRYAEMTVSGQMNYVAFSEYKKGCNTNPFFSFQEIKERAEELAVKRIKAAHDPVVRQFLISTYHQFPEASLSAHPLYSQISVYLGDRYEVMAGLVDSFLGSIVERQLGNDICDE